MVTHNGNWGIFRMYWKNVWPQNLELLKSIGTNWSIGALLVHISIIHFKGSCLLTLSKKGLCFWPLRLWPLFRSHHSFILRKGLGIWPSPQWPLFRFHHSFWGRVLAFDLHLNGLFSDSPPFILRKGIGIWPSPKWCLFRQPTFHFEEGYWILAFTSMASFQTVNCSFWGRALTFDLHHNDLFRQPSPSFILRVWSYPTLHLQCPLVQHP
jgi:hypothetical protein